MMFGRSRHFRISFRVGMSTLLVVVVSATTALILTYVYRESTATAEAAASHLFSGIASRTHDEINRLMSDTLEMVRIGANIPSTDVPIQGDGQKHPTLPFLMKSIAVREELYSFYYGFSNGDFLQVIHARNDERILSTHKAPPETQFIVRAIVKEPGGRIQRWTFLDDQGKALGSATDDAPDFTPLDRPWYELAARNESAVLTEPYVFSSLRELGITAAQRLPGGGGVFGVDVALQRLSQFVRRQKVSESGGVFLFDDSFRLLARPGVVADVAVAMAPPLADVREFKGGPCRTLAGIVAAGQLDRPQVLRRQGIVEIALVSAWCGPNNRTLNIGVIAPLNEFAGHIRLMRNRILLGAIGILVVSLLVTLRLTKAMSGAVGRLAADAERVRHLDFEGEVPRDSFIREFFALGQSFGLMKDDLAAKTRDLQVTQTKLEKLIELGLSMSMEHDGAKLMHMILHGAKDLVNADGGTLYIRTDDNELAFQILSNRSLGMELDCTKGDDMKLPPVPMFDPSTGEPNHHNVVSHAVHEGRSVNIEDAYDAKGFDFSGTRAFDQKTGYRSKSFLTVPLRPQGGEVIGALQLINVIEPGSGAVGPFSPAAQSFVEALAGIAATALYNHDLLNAQEKLLESMVRMVAEAIDAKSPYTRGHCERVPELATMLAEAASAAQEGPLTDFRLATEQEWREFRMGAFLHDCGKVTTPEYVVDKGTKLETIGNRIHEIRTRFEVLLRDAEIARLKSILDGADLADAQAAFDRQHKQLLEDFAFVAECNLGGEVMAEDLIARLKRIASTTWLRYFSDRLGLSREELRRYEGVSEPSLPVEEHLLADKAEHIIRHEGQERVLDGRYGFKMAVPAHRCNLGEVYNLSIPHGTLTEEERFKINEHVVETIVMLENLSFPKHMRRIPEYAGEHHETMVGSGYPRQLTKDNMSVPARILAVADIFEALTARDRPYRKGKTLSEAVAIMAQLKRDQHIDPDLFDLLLRSGVYKRYAERFLRPEQIDEVDVSAYLSSSGDSPLRGR